MKRLKPRLPKECHVSVIGLGGVGSIVARYGAVFLASLNHPAVLRLMDGDGFEPSNATRMIFGSYGNKSKVVRKELIGRFRKTKLGISAVPKYLTRDNIETWIESGQIVILCVDNHATRKLVNDHCAKLKNIVLISGGNDGVGKDSGGAVRRGTYGNVQIYIRKNGKEVTPPLTKFHPEIERPADKMPYELSCTELVVSKPQILFSNLSVASAMLNTLLLHLSGKLPYSELGFDLAKGRQWPVIPI